MLRLSRLRSAFSAEARRQRKAARDFKRLVAPFDREIAEARAKHKAVRPIMQRKAEFVRLKLQVELGRG